MTKKCELCKCNISDDKAHFLPYSKGDWFCSDCISIILGIRECPVCGDEFYYSKRSAYKVICRSSYCTYKFYAIKTKIRKGIELNNKEKEIAIKGGLLH